MQKLLDRIIALHREYCEWRNVQGCDSRKRLRPDQTFRAYVRERAPEVYRALQIQPTLLTSATIALQRDWQGTWVRPIGTRILQKHMPAIAYAYRARYADKEQEKSFEEFMQDILRACACEEDLVEFLSARGNS